MNVLFYKHTTINPLKGGIDRVTDVLYKKFKEEHNVYVLMLEKVAENTDTHFYYVPNPQNEFSDENFKFAEELINDLKIDIIINQEGITPNSSKFILNVNRGKSKLISVLHSDLTSIYGISEKIPIWIMAKLPHKLITSLNKAMNVFFRYKYKQYWDSFAQKNDAICILDESLRKNTAKFIGFSQNTKKIFSLNNPITLQVPSSIERDKKKRTVLYVGRLSAEKNISTLMKAWALIEKKNPNWNLIIVGEGKCKSKLIKYKETNNLQRIVFLGQQNPIPYYTEASIFCLTSFFEGLPLVIIEAMTYGCVPVIFNSFATAQSLVENNKNGYLISPYNTKKFASSLNFLMNHSETIEAMSSESIKKSQNYSIEKIITEWNKLFYTIKNT